MEKFIPYEKLSKREKRKLDAARRNTWGSLNPSTRRPENPKAYRRKKLRIEEDDLDPQLFLQDYALDSRYTARPSCSSSAWKPKLSARCRVAACAGQHSITTSRSVCARAVSVNSRA